VLHSLEKIFDRNCGLSRGVANFLDCRGQELGGPPCRDFTGAASGCAVYSF
jgi:hypothetical protein